MAHKPKERPGMFIYWDTGEIIRNLPADEAKRLVVAMLDFSQHGEVPEFPEDSPLNYIWPMIQSKLIRDADKYEDVREKNRQNGIKSAIARQKRKRASTTVNDRQRNQPNGDGYGDGDGYEKGNVYVDVEGDMGESNYLTLDGLKELWNITTHGILDPINAFSNNQVSKAKDLLISFSPEDIERGFEKASESNYIAGKTAHKTTPSEFSWIIDNFTRILDGEFDN